MLYNINIMTNHNEALRVPQYEQREPLLLPLEAIEANVAECIENLSPEDCERVSNRYLKDPEFKSLLVGVITRLSFIATAAGHVAETEESFTRLILADIFDVDDNDIKIVARSHINSLLESEDVILAVSKSLYANRLNQLNVALRD